MHDDTRVHNPVEADPIHAAAVAWATRAQTLTSAINAGERTRLERSALWVEIEQVAGRDTASDIAAETGLSLGTYRQERGVGFAYPTPDDWRWELDWSHYRATSKRDLDPDLRARLMDQAESLGWSESELRAAVRDALAMDSSGGGESDARPVDPLDYDSPRAYAVDRWVETGGRRAKAEESVDRTLAYVAEWDRAQEGAEATLEATFGRVAPDVVFVDVGAVA